MYWHKNNGLIFSASDLVGFLGYRHRTHLDRRRLDDFVAPPAETSDTYPDLLQEKDFEHEHALRERSQRDGKRIIEMATNSLLEERTAHTQVAMKDRADVMNFVQDGEACFVWAVPSARALGEVPCDEVFERRVDRQLVGVLSDRLIAGFGRKDQLAITPKGRMIADPQSSTNVEPTCTHADRIAVGRAQSVATTPRYRHAASARGGQSADQSMIGGTRCVLQRQFGIEFWYATSTLQRDHGRRTVSGGLSHRRQA